MATRNRENERNTRRPKVTLTIEHDTTSPPTIIKLGTADIVWSGASITLRGTTTKQTACVLSITHTTEGDE